MGVSVEGWVTAVLESWPLQLVVDADGKRVDAVLTEGAAISRGGAAAPPSELLPRCRVRLVGQMTARAPHHTMTVHRVELLD